MSFNLFFFVVVVYNMLSKEKEKASTLSYITIYIFIYIFIYLFIYLGISMHAFAFLRDLSTTII